MFLLFSSYYSNGGIRMNLKDKIQKMIDLGFTYGQLGKICECHSSSISSWMRGSSNISKRMEESLNNHLQLFAKQLEEIWSDSNE